MIIAHLTTRFADAFFPRLMEWQAAGVLFAGGLAMLLNDDLMTPGKPGYVLMLGIASQETWAYAASILGLLRLTVLFINGAWRKSPHARALAAFLSCSIWFALATSFSAVAGWGLVLAGGMLVGDLLNIVRTMRDARVVDDAYRSRYRKHAKQ